MNAATYEYERFTTPTSHRRHCWMKASSIGWQSKFIENQCYEIKLEIIKRISWAHMAFPVIDLAELRGMNKSAVLLQYVMAWRKGHY